MGIPYQDWFLCKQEAATAYLKEVLREVRWVSSDDPFFRDLGLSERLELVSPMRIYDRGHACKGIESVLRCAFRFEMDRGRRGLGHEYVLEFRDSFIRIYMNGAYDRAVDVTGNEHTVTPDALLDVIRELLIWETMDQ